MVRDNWKPRHARGFLCLSVLAGTDFFEPEIDHFVMAITSFETRVRHITRHQTAELSLCGLLIERENSDAQCHPVCLHPHLDRDWVRSMGGVARQSACFPFVRSGD